MKNLFTLLSFFLLVFLAFPSFSQSPWAIVGYNGSTGDGISIVAAEDIPANTTIYFTDREYSDFLNQFNTGESVVSYTTPGSITPKGEVITFTENDTGSGTGNNTFSIACSSGSCGTYTLESGSISYASTTGEYVYLYSDTDNNPANGITEIYSVIISRLTFVSADENPILDYPNCVIVDGFPNSGDHRDFMNSLRSGSVTKSDIENPSNYDAPATNGNQPLDITAFADVTLPVKLLGFDARLLDGNRVGLNWATASEINNDRFEIERSIDGKSFEKIGERRGKGNSFHKVNYSFTDISPSFDMNYYRLKQVDYDGAYAYSDIVQVNMRTDKYNIAVGPNPFTEYIELRSLAGFEQPVVVQITDISGQSVYVNTFDNKSSTLTISLIDLAPGNYFIKIQDGTNETVERLVKI